MNKQRRLRLTKAQLKIDEARQIIQEVHDEEETAQQNLPENLEETPQYEKMQDAIDSMEAALDSLDEADSSINEATN